VHVFYASSDRFPDKPDKSRYGFLDPVQMDQFIAEGLKPPRAK